jgi:hypothetical protein
LLIEVRFDRASARQWQLRLVKTLGDKLGVEVRVRWSEAANRISVGESLLFALERSVNRIPAGGLASAAVSHFSRYMGDRTKIPDLVLDFCGPLERQPTPTWFVTFDGEFGETGALNALFADRPPLVEVVDGSTRAVVASARPGTDSGGGILSAFEDCLHRTTTLILAALSGSTPRVNQAARPPVHRRPGTIRLALKLLVRKARRCAYQSLCYAPHWRVGWRFVDGLDVIDSVWNSGPAWNVIPDDGFHSYADPFPVVFRKRTFLFVEDFDHRCGRAVISAVEFGDKGPLSTPAPVLSSDVHLSYPFVFEDGGDMWMVPESSRTRTIDLYRATSFPDGWRVERTLVSGVEASDATLFKHASRWWMTATVKDGEGSCSDALHLWSAAALYGPWTPHRRNPVLIDISAARPAGRVVRRNDRLIRPVQDCRRGYGAALALAEITRLDDDGFEQSIIKTLEPGKAAWPGWRLHTLNRAGRLECIDGAAINFKLKAKLAHWTTALRP